MLKIFNGNFRDKSFIKIWLNKHLIQYIILMISFIENKRMRIRDWGTSPKLLKSISFNLIL